MPEKYGLTQVLDQLVKQAEAHPGEAKRKPLSKGLRVDVMVKNGQMFLQISRANAWPSGEEWRIVTRDFPHPVPNVTPRRIFDHGIVRYFLKADWQIVEQPELISG